MIHNENFLNSYGPFLRVKTSHKTDEVYSLLIAEYANKNTLRLYSPRDPVYKELRDLYRCSQNLKSQYTQVSNFLENKNRLPKSVLLVYQQLQDHLND